MKKGVLQGAIFPLVLFAFVGVGINYANAIFTTTTRWFFLCLLALLMLRSGRAFAVIGARFGAPLLLYCAWCVGSGLWSIVPELSYLKSLAAVSVAITFAAAGRYWASRWTSNPPLTYLAPILVAVLISAVVGTNFGGEKAPTDGTELYQGLAGNPNFFGLIVAASLPLAIFVLYRVSTRRSATLTRVLATLVVVGLAALLWRAGSRAAILCALSVAGFAFVAMRPTKIIVALALLLGALVVVTVAVPQVNDQLYARFVVKYAPGGDILFSRRDPWEESYNGALQGGWFGLGYGASYGDTGFSGGLTAVGYGREKCNSQLAVIEETGIVGGVFYFILIFTIFAELLRGMKRAVEPEARMEIALITGLASGLLLQSMFEAWWTSPGSVESALFWSTVGVGSGLVRRMGLARAGYAPKIRAHGPSAGPAVVRP